MQVTREQSATEPAAARANGHPSPLRRWLVLGLFAVLCAGGVIYWRRRAPAGSEGASPATTASASAESRVVPVVVVKAERRDVPVYLDGLGNAQPLATVTVKSQVDGRLDSVKFTEGKAVKKGEVLAQIDPRPFVIALHQAEATLARDDAQAKNARRNLERYTNLVSQKLIPQQQVDDQQTAYDQALASVAADRTQIASARLSLDYARITSPIDGVTGVRLVDPGNIVHAGDAGGIVVVTQLDPMAVVFTLPQDDLPRVSRELAAGPLTAEAYSRDGDSRLGVGRLQLIDNQVNQATATIRLKAIFPNPDKVLWPNAFIKVRLLLSTIKGAVVVPAQAIQRGPSGAFVYVVDADKKAAMRSVVVDAAPDDIAVIEKGLAAGDDVVVEGQNALRPGAKVAPRPPAVRSPKGGPPVRTRGASP
jgi:multidrug efflux system membrane fusion protein